MNRRGFMAFLGIGAAAAPAAVKSLQAATPDITEMSPLPNSIKERFVPALFQDGDMLFDGVIVRSTDAELTAFKSEIMREYVRENLFIPYMGDVNASD